jgi:hypothetical protein
VGRQGRQGAKGSRLQSITLCTICMVICMICMIRMIRIIYDAKRVIYPIICKIRTKSNNSAADDHGWLRHSLYRNIAAFTMLIHFGSRLDARTTRWAKKPLARKLRMLQKVAFEIAGAPMAPWQSYQPMENRCDKIGIRHQFPATLSLACSAPPLCPRRA